MNKRHPDDFTPCGRYLGLGDLEPATAGEDPDMYDAEGNFLGGEKADEGHASGPLQRRWAGALAGPRPIHGAKL